MQKGDPINIDLKGREPPAYIAIEGPIGVGKTTLAHLLAQSFNYEIGFGIDFYLVYFKFSPSIRGIFSIQNELIQDNNSNSPWTSNIKSLLSQGFAINLTFE